MTRARWVGVLTLAALVVAAIDWRWQWLPREGMQSSSSSSSSSDKPVVWMFGDSVLNNRAYVHAGRTVEEWLHVLAAFREVRMFAEDHATVEDTAEQVASVTERPPRPLAIVVSAGGNDLLRLAHQDAGAPALSTVQQAWGRLLDELHRRWPSVPVYALDVYTPTDPAYRTDRHVALLRQWNDGLRELARKHEATVVAVSSALTDPDDFVYGVEPSDAGGQKIATLLASMVR